MNKLHKTQPSQIILKILVSVFALLILTNCSNGSSSTTTSTSPQLKLISIGPAEDGMFLGEKTQYIADGYFSDGSIKDISHQVNWLSTNSSVAEIDTKGLATSIGVGVTLISASLGDVKSGAALLGVVSDPSSNIIFISASASKPSLEVGRSTPSFLTVIYQTGPIVFGRQIDAESADWTSSNDGIASIDSFGVATGISPGEATITANFAGESASYLLTVESAQN